MSGAVSGYYSDVGAPLHDLCIFGPEAKRITVTVLIDTGVNVPLVLFEEYARLAHWPTTEHFDTLLLADESSIGGYWSSGYIEFFGRMLFIDALIIRAPMHTRRQTVYGYIGMGLLRGSEIHLKPSSFEIIEKSQ